MKVTNDQACELLELFRNGDNTSDWDDFDLNLELVQEELVDTSRWSHIHERIYKDLDTGKFYATIYSTGATECQDQRPYEYDGAEIEFDEVVPVEVVKIEYYSVKKEN